MALYKLSTRICVMKGFILDGIPKNHENAEVIFNSIYT